MQGIVLAAAPAGAGQRQARRHVRQVGTGPLHKYAGTTFKMDGRELLVLTEDDVLAVVLCGWTSSTRNRRYTW